MCARSSAQPPAVLPSCALMAADAYPHPQGAKHNQTHGLCALCECINNYAHYAIHYPLLFYFPPLTRSLSSHPKVRVEYPVVVLDIPHVLLNRGHRIYPQEIYTWRLSCSLTSNPLLSTLTSPQSICDLRSTAVRAVMAQPSSSIISGIFPVFDGSRHSGM